jgi:hypothetical protein
MDSEKIPKFVDLINSYYSFVLLVYALVLYAASHTHLFKYVFVIVTLALAGWLGYIIKGFLEQRNQRYGFKVLSNVMSYDVGRNDKYTLRFHTKIRAESDHLFVYPVGHQWTGGGQEVPPKVTGEGQTLLANIEKNGEVERVVPYRLTETTEGEWQYWFVALNPPLQKGETADIKYSQVFHDTSKTAIPSLYYYVRTSTKRLELNVTFPANSGTKKITATYAKLTDGMRPYVSNAVVYDPDKRLATWTIENPKKGYCYRISWS